MKLVLLPGMDGTGDLFQPFVDVLPPSIQPIVVSYPVDQPLGYKELEQFVRSILPDDEPYAILGESFSGPIAISIAASAPVQLRALVLCCTFAKNPQPQLAPLQSLIGLVPIQQLPAFVSGYFLLGSNTSTAYRAQFGKALSKVSSIALRARLKAALTIDASDQLSKISVPTLYLRATLDRAVPKSASELILRHIPGLQMELWTLTHHMRCCSANRKKAENAMTTFPFALSKHGCAV